MLTDDNRGMITVEMMLVFPIIVFIVLSTIIFAMYISDIVSVRAYLHRYEIMNINNQKDDALINKEITNSLEKMREISEVEGVQVERDKDKIKIVVDIKTKLFFLNSIYEEKISESFIQTNNRKYITKTKIFVDTLENITN